MEKSYYQLSKLPYKVLRQKNDHYYPIVDPTVIRRNYSFRDDKIIQQSVLFDLTELLLLSKIHIRPSHPKIIRIEIAKVNKPSSFVVVENEVEIIGGKTRIIDIGSLPCRYLKITYLKGCPIMDYSTVELFGIKIKDIQLLLNEDTMDLIYYKTYDFLYRNK
jgi:hypothetical protein